jgi:hypothetical protein
MPKYPIGKYSFTIFPKDSPDLDAAQTEESDDGEDMNARAIRNLADVLPNVSRPGEDAVAASNSQPSSSRAKPLNKEKFDYSLPIFKVQSKSALVQRSSRPTTIASCFKVH